MDGQPINGANIHVREVPADPENELEMIFTTDNDGQYASEEPHSIFFCNDLVFEINTDGVGEYENLRITYSLADNYTELPAQPIPVRIVAALMEKLDADSEP